jgi:hypothetical protein
LVDAVFESKRSPASFVGGALAGRLAVVKTAAAAQELPPSSRVTPTMRQEMFDQGTYDDAQRK